MNDNSSNEHLKKWQLQLRKGLLSFLVLAHLDKQEYYGYSLIISLSKHLGSEMAEGTIYPLLNRLKREGLIDFRWEIMESGPARKYYKITTSGEKLLKQMNNHWGEINQGIERLKS